MICEWCRIRQATDHHHCLVGRDKNNKELDDPRNIGDVCRECHRQWIGTGGRKVREAWWNIKCKLHGEEDMREWYSSLTLRTRERYW
jgi:hypothetical protein